MASIVDINLEETGGNIQLPIVKLPRAGEASGVDDDLVRLCATVSKLLYRYQEFRNRLSFQNALLEELKDTPFAQANKLSVRFYETGIRIGTDGGKFTPNPPTFAGILVNGDTLILGWRGSVTLRDFLVDLKFETCAPEDWEIHYRNGLRVQSSMLKLQQHFLKIGNQGHGRDILNYVHGNYSSEPNKVKKDGKKIKQIILTGHSLGGGLAQVAHLLLTVPGSFVRVSDKVDVRTIAFSAPMTSIVKPDAMKSPLLRDFLENTIRPNMTNFVFSEDVVPHGYSHLLFLKSFLEELEKDEYSGGSTLSVFKESLIQFCKKGLFNEDKWKQFSHIGKIFQYRSCSDEPILTTFPDSRYMRMNTTISITKTALDDHMALIKPGLTFSEKYAMAG